MCCGKCRTENVCLNVKQMSFISLHAENELQVGVSNVQKKDMEDEERKEEEEDEERVKRRERIKNEKEDDRK